MQKSVLNSAINKYHLGGLVESAKWVVKDNSVFINFISPNKDAIGKVEAKGFELENSSFGIYDTSQLLKLVKIMNGVIELKLTKNKHISTELLMADNQYDLSFYLSDTTLIDEVPDVKVPAEPALVIDIDDEFSNKFINARKALGDITQFTIGVKKDKALMTIGEKSAFSNKVKFGIEGEIIKQFDPIPFSVDFFNEILSANIDETGKITVYEEGLMYVEFFNESVKSHYFLVRLQES